MLRNRLLNCAALIFAMLFAAVFAPAQNQLKTTKDERALTALVKKMTEAQSKFDAATLAKIYAPDYIEISPVGEVDPREKAIGFYKPQSNTAADNVNQIVSSDEFIIRSYGNFAVVIARITFTRAGEESSAVRPPLSFRATLSCRKEKGVWKIASVQATAIRPPRLQPTK